MSELEPRSHGSAPEVTIARHGRLGRSSPWTTLLKFIGAALVVLLVSGASLGAIMFAQLKGNITTVSIGADEEEDAPVPSVGAYEGGFNILIIGSDECEKEGGCADREATLNDVNMLLHVSEDQTNAVAVSIPRDLVVPVPECTDPDGGGTTPAADGRPINETLALGGIPCVVETVEDLTGLSINFAGLITFNGVIAMGDAVGGVPVCVTGPIDDKYTGLVIPKAGTYTLGGQDALNFLRTRHGVGDGSDLTRISSQQVYLSSLVRTLQSPDTLGNPLKVYSLAQAATKAMTLSENFSSVDTLVSVAMALRNIPPQNVMFVQYPGTLGVGGMYEGKVAPIKAKASELFDLIESDTPFTLANVGDGDGSIADPNAPGATAAPAPGSTETPAPVVTDPATPVDPNATPDPAATPGPAVIDVKGQTAADYTCSIANN
jgi:LCP family protein required for cell wall assembly